MATAAIFLGCTASFLWAPINCGNHGATNSGHIVDTEHLGLTARFVTLVRHDRQVVVYEIRSRTL
jgi:hypothetical protein